LCPYCGDSQSDTVDHFLPKTKYHVFSIYPFNLVPSCIRCNGKKIARFQNNENEILFHPYLHCITDQLNLDISYSLEPRTLLNIQVLPAENSDIEIRVRNTFDRLKLVNIINAKIYKKVNESTLHKRLIADYLNDVADIRLKNNLAILFNHMADDVINDNGFLSLSYRFIANNINANAMNKVYLYR
jgi:hypothetical protein